MKSMAKRAALILLALAAVSASAARAEDDPACAKYQDPLAYNACLASHGPKANIATNPRPTQAAHAAPIQPEGGRPVPTQRAKRWRHANRGRGRVHMEFRVK